MPIIESEAIILRSFPLGEGDRLVSFLDRQSGRMRGVARGARLPKSRFGSSLEMLSYVRIWYFEREGRELVRINQCELLESFLDVHRDYDASIFLALISEITEAVLGEREPADPQFRLVLLSTRSVRGHGASPVVLAYFSLWTVRLAGWLGAFDRCVRCGRPLGPGSVFGSVETSGFTCKDCRRDGMAEISGEALDLAREILTMRLDQILPGKSKHDVAFEISSYALDLLEQHTERRFKTRQMVAAREGSRSET